MRAPKVKCLNVSAAVSDDSAQTLLKYTTIRQKHNQQRKSPVAEAKGDLRKTSIFLEL